MKDHWREKMRAALADMPPEQAAEKSYRASVALTRLPEFNDAQVIMLYMVIPAEIDPARVARSAWKAGKTVLVPQTSWASKTMEPVEIQSLSAGMVQSPQGIREPREGKVWPIEELDLIVVPALAYDHLGNRLGRGGGFYDRFLARPGMRAITCGLAFSEQVAGPLPVHDNDRRVDLLVTDEDVLRFNSRKTNLSPNTTGE